MTYEESSTLMTNSIFRGRVKVSCLKFADSIMIEQPNVPAHNARLRWANQTFQQPDLTDSQVTPPVVMDPAVQSSAIDPDGDASIADGALQSAVEATVNKIF